MRVAVVWGCTVQLLVLLLLMALDACSGGCSAVLQPAWSGVFLLLTCCCDCCCCVALHLICAGVRLRSAQGH
jgi:hypothetical protein